MTGTNWTKNCDVSFGISNNRRQTKLKNHRRLFNANCIWSRLLRLGLPSLIALARKASFSFPQFAFPTLFPPFWSFGHLVQLSSTKLGSTFESTAELNYLGQPKLVYIRSSTCRIRRLNRASGTYVSYHRTKQQQQQ